jgi:hypothetical protein
MLFEGCNIHTEIPLLKFIIVTILHFVFLDIIFKVIPLLANSCANPL